MKIFKHGYSLKKNKNKSIKKIKVVSIITSICFIILTSCSSDDSNSSSSLKDDIANQEYVNIIEDNASDLPENAQIAIGIIDNESTEFIGVINNNGVLRGIDNADKIFEIGSITKTFTAICLSHLIATNEASLTETLQSQFDFQFQAGNEINFLQLANHTSGLPRLPTNVDEIIDLDINDPYASYSINNFESYFQNHVVLNHASGTNHEYSNLGMGSLGYVLSRKKETSYEGLLQSLIFEPLQMSNSTTLLANVDASKLILGRDINGNVVSNWNFTNVMSGGGSIKSSVVDLEKFIRKNFENDVVYNLPQETTFNIDEGYSIGLGWFIIESEGFRVLLHDGGTGGYTSYVMIDKDNNRAVLALSNVADYSEQISELVSSLLENISIE